MKIKRIKRLRRTVAVKLILAKWFLKWLINAGTFHSRNYAIRLSSWFTVFQLPFDLLVLWLVYSHGVSRAELTSVECIGAMLGEVILVAKFAAILSILSDPHIPR